MRRREKPLTLEEALEAARLELAPRWFGSTPLFAAYRDDAGSALYPLEAEARKHSWIWCVVDLASFESVSAIECFNRWHAMYGDLGPRFLLVITKYGGSLAGLPNASDRLRKRYRFDYPVTFDPNSEFAEALGCETLPKAVFFHGEKRLAETRGSWDASLETAMQKALRATDPGLPLFAPVDPGVVIDRGASRVALNDKSLRYNEHWRPEEGDQVVFQERGTLTISLKGKGAGIVAMSDGESRPSRVFVTQTGGAAVPADQWGKDIVLDDAGRTYFDVTAYGLYEFYRREAATAVEFQLRFASATETPLRLKGVRVQT